MMSDTPDKKKTWREKFWNAVQKYVDVCGGNVESPEDDPATQDCIHARRDIEALISSHPEIEQQIRLELAGTRIRMNAAIVTAYSLIDIAQHMATGQVSEENQKKAQETFSNVKKQMKRLVEVKT